MIEDKSKEIDPGEPRHLPPTDLDIYAEIADDVEKEVESVVSATVLPSPKDYEKGFFKRFFIARYDDQIASEVTQDFFKKKFNKLAKDLYKKVEVRWYLKDNVNFDKRKVLKQLTAFNMNEEEVAFKSEQLPQLKNTTKDFSQFIG